MIFAFYRDCVWVISVCTVHVLPVVHAKETPKKLVPVDIFSRMSCINIDCQLAGSL